MEEVGKIDKKKTKDKRKVKAGEVVQEVEEDDGEKILKDGEAKDDKEVVEVEGE